MNSNDINKLQALVDAATGLRMQGVEINVEITQVTASINGTPAVLLIWNATQNDWDIVATT